MKCISCGAVSDDNAIFCSNCGSRLKPAEDITAPEENAAEAAEEAVENAEEAAAEAVSRAKEAVEEKQEDIVEAVSEESADDIGQVSESVTDEVSEEAENVSAAIDEALEALTGVTADETPGSAPEAAADTENNAADKADEAPAEETEAELPKLVRAAEKAGNNNEAAVSQIKDEQNASSPAAPLYIEQDRRNAPAPVYTPPVQPQPVPADTGAAPVKVGAGRITGATVIAIFAVVFMIIVSLMFCVRLGVSGDILKKRVEKMDINTVLNADVGEWSLSDAIYNETGFSDAAHGLVSRSEFRSYMADTDLLSYSAKYIKDYTDYIIGGDIPDPSINSNDLAEFFVSNSETADNTLPVKMQTADYNRIRSTLESKETAKNFSIDEWSRKLNFRLENTNFIFSYVTIGIFLALVLVLLIWIAVVVDKRGRHIVGFYGTIFKWSGAIVFIIGLGVVAGASIAHVITGEFIFYLCASLLLPFGVFALCIGAAELLIGFVFNRIRSGMKNKEKRNKAVEKALAGTAV